ncbi:Ankyrin-2 [Bachmanniomyces sp. S44760]|nr:Ankyrin-2 [Bachmanniomyces sp. S44760]
MILNTHLIFLSAGAVLLFATNVSAASPSNLDSLTRAYMKVRSPAIVEDFCFGSAEEAKKALDAGGGDFTATDQQGNTALMCACVSSIEKQRLVGDLIKQGAPLDAINHQGQTFLSLAAQYGSFTAMQEIQRLFAAQTPIGLSRKRKLLELRDKKDYSALHWAVNRFTDHPLPKDYVPVVKSLLDMSMLIKAPGGGTLDRTLINMPGPQGLTPLCLLLHGLSHRMWKEKVPKVGSQQSGVQIIKLLLEHGAEIEEKCGPTAYRPLHLAASNNYLEAVRFLVSKGADVRATNGAGKTPLQLAEEKSSTYTIETFKNNNKAIIKVLEAKD